MYKYTQKDLLKNPEKYQFSKFEGYQFFNDYVENRQVFLTSNRSFNIQEIKELYSEDIEFEDSIYLKNYLISSILDNKYDLNITKKLIQRFEVSKKLYTHYSLPDIRKNSDLHHDIDSYYLFSLYLAIYIKNFNDKYLQVIVFNSLLKVNDLIISIHDTSNKLHNKILKYSLNTELGFFNVLKGEL